jgi:Fe2+ transport system protein FeoA
MRLTEAHIGDVVRVVGFSGGKTNARLLRVGLYPGDRMRVLRQAPLDGPLLVDVSGRELALGLDVAARILVEAE